jgi:hypothetical protein
MDQLRIVILNASYTKFPIVDTSKIGSELHVISGFRREVNEIGAPLGCYAAYSDNSLQTFRDNLSVPIPKVKKSRISWPPDQSYFVSVQEVTCGSRAKY